MSKEKFDPKDIERVMEEARRGEATERPKEPSKKEVLGLQEMRQEIAADKVAKEAEREKRREWYRQPIGQEETEETKVQREVPTVSENPAPENETSVKDALEAYEKNSLDYLTNEQLKTLADFQFPEIF